jgi:hypothetical protein
VVDIDPRHRLTYKEAVAQLIRHGVSEASAVNVVEAAMHDGRAPLPKFGLLVVMPEHGQFVLQDH